MSELSRIVASVDPKATVTMKSNAFSCPSVLLPVTRRSATKAAYDTEPMIRTRRMSGHVSNHIRFMLLQQKSRQYHGQGRRY